MVNSISPHSPHRHIANEQNGNMFCHGMNKWKIFFASINKGATSKLANWAQDLLPGSKISSDASSASSALHTFPSKSVGGQPTLQERQKSMQKVKFRISFKWRETRKNYRSFLNQLMQLN